MYSRNPPGLACHDSIRELIYLTLIVFATKSIAKPPLHTMMVDSCVVVFDEGRISEKMRVLRERLTINEKHSYT